MSLSGQKHIFAREPNSIAGGLSKSIFTNSAKCYLVELNTDPEYRNREGKLFYLSI